MSFHLFFAGAEEPGWRRMLLDEGVENIALTYMHLRKRLPKRRPWVMAEQIPDGVRVLLDSGAYTANKDPGRMDRDGWINYDGAYVEFVEANLDRIDLVTEFDSLVLGEQYIRDMREDFWDRKVPAEKFLPVWHPQHGLRELDALAERYPRIAVVDESLRTDRTVLTRINMLAQKHNTKVHGIAVTKPDVLREVRFDSAASTSWLSPSRFGDTIVWDGTKLRRYPKKYKDQARRRHKMLFTRAGFDADKILADDSTEVLRFTIWSWLQLEEAIARRRPGGGGPAAVVPTHDTSGVTTTAPEADEGYEEIDPGDVGTRLPAVRNYSPAAVATTRAAEDRVIIPVIGIETMRSQSVEGGGEGEGDVEIVRINERSVMVCDSCYMSDRCPKYSPGSECAFDIPIKIRNKPQLTAMLTGMMEMQAQRLVFARLNEQLEGGYPDPNVSQEMDRFMKMVESVKEIQDDRDFFEFTVRTKAAAGMMSRIFGQAPPARQAPIEPVVDTNAVMAHVASNGASVASNGDDEVADAEIVEP